MGEPTHECRYCGRTFEEERSYLRHLKRDHDPAELGRIDRHRVDAAFGGRTTWWTDLLTERLSPFLPVGTVDWLGSLSSPVPQQTLWDLALLAVGLTVGVAVVLALLGP